MSNDKKLIGIPAYKSVGQEHFGGGVNHVALLEEFGNVKIIMPWEEKTEVDLLYLPGGLDLSPASYGEVPKVTTSNHDVMKEFFYHERLKNYVGNTPIFGVCLGFQMLGAYFGCKLTQSLKFHEDSEERWEGAHDVKVVQPISKSFKKGEEFEVNSHHHQCILQSQMSSELTILATTEHDEPTIDGNDLIVEAFKHNSLPIAGVQWHPEEWYDRFSIELMYSLLFSK